MKKTVAIYILNKTSSSALSSFGVIQLVTEGNGNPPSPTELSTSGPQGRPLGPQTAGVDAHRDRYPSLAFIFLESTTIPSSVPVYLLNIHCV